MISKAHACYKNLYIETHREEKGNYTHYATIYIYVIYVHTIIYGKLLYTVHRRATVVITINHQTMITTFICVFYFILI